MTSSRPSCLRLAALAAALALLGASAVACAARHPIPSRTVKAEMPAPGDLTLDRGDWVMGQQTGVWLVEVAGATQGTPPERIGYMTSRLYREVRGGPTFTMYEVTSLDRRDVLGIIDSLGNAKRFRPQRDAAPTVEAAGNATMPLSVQAIFQTMRPVTLIPTTERALAFEAVDKNKDGYLDRDEWPRINSRIGSPDTNRDGRVDPQEFEAADDL